MLTDDDDLCLICVRWIGRLGGHISHEVAQIAAERGTTIAQARADLLAAYHRHHTREYPNE